MSKKVSAIIFLVVACILIGIIVAITNSSQTPVSTDAIATTPSVSTPSVPSVPSTPTTQPTKPVTASTYTLAQVAQHKTKADCWTTINGGVYNVTSWISEHPGGAEAIMSLCGIDGSAEFNDQHGGEKRPANELASFKIGTLAK